VTYIETSVFIVCLVLLLLKKLSMNIRLGFIASFMLKFFILFTNLYILKRAIEG